MIYASDLWLTLKRLEGKETTYFFNLAIINHLCAHV